MSGEEENMLVVIWIVAFAIALLCHKASRILGLKAAEARQEANDLRFQNQQDAVAFANAGGEDAIHERAYYGFYGPDLESVEELAKVATAKASQYSLCANLCAIGSGGAGAVAFVAVIYPFLQL